jgi:hypothetical protein
VKLLVGVMAGFRNFTGNAGAADSGVSRKRVDLEMR